MNFTVFLFSVPPSPPQDCRISNGSVDGLRVTCQPGFDGGLPQSFLLEVRRGGGEGSNKVSRLAAGGNGNDVLSRTRSVSPDFVVSGLAPGTEYSIEVRGLLLLFLLSLSLSLSVRYSFCILDQNSSD